MSQFRELVDLEEAVIVSTCSRVEIVAVARHLVAKNFKHIIIANRTLERAEAMAGAAAAECAWETRKVDIKQTPPTWISAGQKS